MSASEIERTLVRLAYEIVEKNSGVEALGLVGSGDVEFLSPNGWAKLLRASKTRKCRSELWTLLFTATICRPWDRSRSCSRKRSDLTSGTRTSCWSMMCFSPGVPPARRWTLCFIMDGPGRVQLCVLIDRGHREIPVEATFVGRHVQTTINEVIEVKLTEIDDAEKVLLMEK